MPEAIKCVTCGRAVFPQHVDNAGDCVFCEKPAEPKDKKQVPPEPDFTINVDITSK